MRLITSRLTTALGATALLVAATATTAHAGSAVARAPDTPVIVKGTDAASADAAVRRVGGVVEQRLTLIDSVAARVPAGDLPSLRRAPGVLGVTGDGTVRLNADKWKADDDQNSLYNLTKYAGVHDAWGKTDPTGRKITGKGIGVAVIDSGISPVPGLDGTGKVFNGPDLSFESQADNTRHLDTFGHGTHMAGIIAGRDRKVSAGNENDKKHFVGVAPDAHLINLKVAAADGAVDVSQVIAAIDWAVAHRNDPGLNIRVLNLSFGTDSAQDPRLDPLSHAVEAAWKQGIVVVVSVGNDGLAERRVGMPAQNPYVLAVGAADPMGTDDRDDDTVAGFSTGGSLTTRRADLVAAGKSLVSLRVPNSYVDTMYPQARLAEDREQRFFRGSGTSQAAAFVSGAAALLLQQRPNLTPDQVKRLLTTTAEAMPEGDPVARGAGQLDLKAAFEAPTPAYKQTHLPSTGLGSLDAARGTARVVDPDNGVEIRGEVDIMGQPWSPAGWSLASTTGTAWTGGDWNGRTWSGRTWSGRTWSSAVWDGRTWSGRTWSGRTWSSVVWDGRTWSGRTWSGPYVVGTDLERRRMVSSPARLKRRPARA